MNIFAEWNMEDALAVRYEEGFIEGFIKGFKETCKENCEEELKLLVDYIQKLFDQGFSPDEVKIELNYIKLFKKQIAKKLLSAGSSYEFVSKITGLDIDTVMGINADL